MDRTVIVAGLPIPKGSTTRNRAGRIYDSQGHRLKAWQATIGQAIHAAQWPPILVGPVTVRLGFTLDRPQAHHIASDRRRPVRDRAPIWHVNRPDLDKLARAVLDALTQAGAFRDDGQVAVLACEKHYGDRPGVRISISPVQDLPPLPDDAQ